MKSKNFLKNVLCGNSQFFVYFKTWGQVHWKCRQYMNCHWPSSTWGKLPTTTALFASTGRKAMCIFNKKVLRGISVFGRCRLDCQTCHAGKHGNLFAPYPGQISNDIITFCWIRNCASSWSAKQSAFQQEILSCASVFDGCGLDCQSHHTGKCGDLFAHHPGQIANNNSTFLQDFKLRKQLMCKAMCIFNKKALHGIQFLVDAG